MGETQKDITEFTEKAPLKRFRQKIGEHMVSLTIPKSDIVSIEAVRNKKISNVDMT